MGVMFSHCHPRKNRNPEGKGIGVRPPRKHKTMLAQLIAQHKQQSDFTESVHNIIMDETDNGRTIVRFLLSVMEGELPDFKVCHRMDAARLLEKFGGTEAKAFIDNLDPQPPTRRERRDTRRADRRIQTELSQIVKEETNNGRAIVTFLVNAMEGELADFKPHHRMSASRELLRQGSQYALVEEETEAEPVETIAEREERLRREEMKRQREEAVEFSLHGPVYYEVYSDPCPCEDRRHDCKGNELSEEEYQEAIRIPPAMEDFLNTEEELEDFRRRYEERLTRLNPGMDLDFSIIRWRKLTHDP